MGATDKMNFLENTLLKRKSLIVASAASKKRLQKAAQKRLKKSQKRNQGVQTQCPVYKCFRECKDEEGLMKHYNEAHGDLKALGLDLFQDPNNHSSA
jgi:L-cysteine desulfidase